MIPPFTIIQLSTLFYAEGRKIRFQAFPKCVQQLKFFRCGQVFKVLRQAHTLVQFTGSRKTEGGTWRGEEPGDQTGSLLSRADLPTYFEVNFPAPPQIRRIRYVTRANSVRVE